MVVLLSRSRGGRDDSLIKGGDTAFDLLRLDETRTRRGRLDRPPATVTLSCRKQKGRSIFGPDYIDERCSKLCAREAPAPDQVRPNSLA